MDHSLIHSLRAARDRLTAGALTALAALLLLPASTLAHPSTSVKRPVGLQVAPPMWPSQPEFVVRGSGLESVTGFAVRNGAASCSRAACRTQRALNLPVVECQNEFLIDTSEIDGLGAWRVTLVFRTSTGWQRQPRLHYRLSRETNQLESSAALQADFLLVAARCQAPINDLGPNSSSSSSAPPAFPPDWTTATVGPRRISLSVMPSVYRGVQNVTIRVPLKVLRTYGSLIDFRAIEAVPSAGGTLQFSRARKLSIISWHRVLYLVASLPTTMHWTFFIEFDLAPHTGNEITIALTGQTADGSLTLGGFWPSQARAS